MKCLASFLPFALALALAGASEAVVSRTAAPAVVSRTAAPAVVSRTAAPAVVSDWAEGAFDQADARVEARLLIHPERSAGDRVRAGVIFTLDPGWHLYWRNPGDAGLPTRLSWRGGEAGPTQWPAPAAFSEDAGATVSYGYEGNVLLASEIQPEQGARTLGVEVDALACRSSCIPAHFTLERPLDAQVGPETANAIRRLFALHDESLPTPAQVFGVAPKLATPDPEQPSRIELRVEPCRSEGACTELSDPVFFPAQPGLRVIHANAASGRIQLELERDADTASLQGVLELRGNDGRFHHLDLDMAVPVPIRGFDWAALASALAFGVLGGLLLNLMPCVLPVLALKAFSVAQLAGRGRREALAHGAAYAAGVLLSMLALGGAVLVLRSAGHEVGWGFQLQSPAFVVVVAVLCTAFALNLLGVFEIGFVPGGLASVGAEASGARRSFFEGLLAVALATPCSAPFLGTAVGFAFASEGALVLAIFAAIGLGLAAPFVVICAFPPAARFLPRSGPWMNELRSLLGFALLATVVWLAWVLGRSTGVDGLAGLLALLLLVALGAWSFGRLEGGGVRGLVAVSSVGLIVLGSNLIALAPGPVAAGLASGPVAAGLASAPVPAGLAPAPRAAGESALVPAAWSPDLLAALRAEGRPVVVVFSADWCLTCKWNERSVLASPEVSAALARGGFALLHADWTRRDEAIRKELLRFGRAGVPLTLVYLAGAAEPQVMPELLSIDRVLSALGGSEPRHAQAARAADAS